MIIYAICSQFDGQLFRHHLARTATACTQNLILTEGEEYAINPAYQPRPFKLERVQ